MQYEIHPFYSVRFIVLLFLYSLDTNKRKEESLMKTATIRNTQVKSRPPIPYPNAATRAELLHKLLDLLITGLIGAGLAASLLLLAAMA